MAWAIAHCQCSVMGSGVAGLIKETLCGACSARNESMTADSLLSVELSEMMTSTGSLACDLTTDKADRQANSPRFRVGIRIVSFLNKAFPFPLMVASAQDGVEHTTHATSQRPIKLQVVADRCGLGKYGCRPRAPGLSKSARHDAIANEAPAILFQCIQIID